MLHIDFEKNGNCICVSVKGHAGYGEFGKDILCAGVSALIMALASRVKELEDGKAFKEPPTVKLDSGDALISCRPRYRCRRRVEDAFELIENGCVLLWMDYGQYIDLKTFEEGLKSEI